MEELLRQRQRVSNLILILNRKIRIARTDAIHLFSSITLKQEDQLDQVVLVEAHRPVLGENFVQKRFHLPVEALQQRRKEVVGRQTRATIVEAPKQLHHPLTLSDGIVATIQAYRVNSETRLGKDVFPECLHVRSDGAVLCLFAAAILIDQLIGDRGKVAAGLLDAIEQGRNTIPAPLPDRPLLRRIILANRRREIPLIGGESEVEKHFVVTVEVEKEFPCVHAANEPDVERLQTLLAVDHEPRLLRQF